MYIVPIILSGGASGRLWPLTSEQKPKPFLRVSNGLSLLQSTLLRAKLVADLTSEHPLQNLISPKVITVTNQQYLAATLADYDDVLMPQLNHHILAEPVRRDTAAAVVNACICAAKLHDDDAIVVVMPADHVIEDDIGFKRAVKQAVLMAKNTDTIVSIGIMPNEANQAFGYMQVKENKVMRFIEKPSQEAAQSFISNGNYYWNSGIFCCKASILLQQLKVHCSALLAGCETLMEKSVVTLEENKSFYWLNKSIMEKLPQSSIDYSLMEKLQDLSFVRADMDWHDVGSWDSYSKLFDKDEAGNVAGELAFAEDSNNCLVYTEQKPIALLGVEDIVVIDSASGILVADRSQVQNVKGISRKIVSKQIDKNGSYRPISSEEKRPWGKFSVLSKSNTHKVKRLEINAHSCLSLQSHRYRAEHWVVVEGVANIELDGVLKTLSVDEALFVPIGARHRIENKTDNLLVIIETQTGSYFGEDDEIRYEDVYGRVD